METWWRWWWWRKNYRNVVAVVVVGRETIEMWWWWSWERKTIEFNSLKTYINAQHSTPFSVYILLLRS